jgi:hypothetical protein
MAASGAALESLESIEAALRAGVCLSWHRHSALQGVLYAWVEEYDRGAALHEPPEAPLANDMHLMGACVCVLLGRSPQLQGEYDLRKSLGPLYSKIIFTEKPLDAYDVEDLQNMVVALQLEFPSIYTYREGQGYSARCEVEGTCVRVLARLGQWLAVRWQDAGAVGAGGVETNMPGEALRGLATLDPDGFCRVRLDALVFLLDAVHSMLALNRLLERAQARDNAEAAARVVVGNHHLEASSEAFFTHSMTADCVVGTVAQYAHKFAYLFHSISQAIYYNRPNYVRQRQLPLARLLEPTTAQAGPKAVNVLALLLELRPEVPVLFEHTGAGHRSTHAQHAWAWVLWADYVLLVDAHMRVSAALDVRALAALLAEDEGSGTGSLDEVNA